MRNLILLVAFAGLTLTSFAQQNTTPQQSADTVNMRTPTPRGNWGYYVDGRRVSNVKARPVTKLPLIRPFDHIRVFSASQLMSFPQRNINSVAAIVAGVDSRAGEVPNIRGARPENTAYYIDGMRVSFLSEDDKYVSMLK